MWTTKGYTLLHSGRGLPTGDTVARRNEGVGILLDPAMTQAWRRGGESWSAVSSRLVVAHLKIADAGESTVPGRRWTRRRDLFVTVVSAYAPTGKATAAVKDRFFEHLQRVVDNIPASDVLLLLGDFNTRVDSWVAVTGRTYLGVLDMERGTMPGTGCWRGVRSTGWPS